MPILAVNHHYFRVSRAGRGIHPVTPAALRAEVLKIRASGWRLGREEDISALLAGELGSDDRVCVLTFDDGLKEQLAALDLLSELGACALCYVPTRPLTDLVVLDVHKLHMIHAEQTEAEIVAELDRRYGFSRHVIDEELSTNQYPYDAPFARRAKYFLNFVLDAEQRLDWIHRTFASLFGDERVVAESLYMNKKDVKRLAAGHLLGSHGHAHVALATLGPVELRHDLACSREILATLTGRAPVGVSYPFGSKAALGAPVYAAARDVGYRYGLTMTRGVNASDADLDPFTLRRVNVNDLGAYVQATQTYSAGG